MSITKEAELVGMKKASEAVALTLKEMRKFAQPGMTTKYLDDYGGQLLNAMGAKSAPYLTYGFPGWTCVSVNNEFCHGIPSKKRVLKEGDLINIDVSAELMPRPSSVVSIMLYRVFRHSSIQKVWPAPC